MAGNARYSAIALKIRPVFGQASNIALLVLAVLGLVLNFQSMIGLVGSRGILAGVVFLALALVAGYLLGGSDPKIRSVMGLGTAQRNISAALVVAGQNFDADVVTYLMVIAVLGLVILMPAAGELELRWNHADSSAVLWVRFESGEYSLTTTDGGRRLSLRSIADLASS